jgi:hypothetical protein
MGVLTSDTVTSEAKTVNFETILITVVHEMIKDSVNLLKLNRILGLRCRSVVRKDDSSPGLACKVLHQSPMRSWTALVSMLSWPVGG